MSSPSSAPRGVLVAGLGALAALASLWLPWYTIKLPELFRDALGNAGSTAPGGGAPTGAEGFAGAFAGLFRGLASVLPEEITANGWTAMSGGDVGLAVAASAVALLVVVVAGGSSGLSVDRGVAGRMMALAGLVVTAIAAYHVVSKPGAGAGALSATVAIKPGIWVALAGGTLMVAGGLMTARPPRSAAADPVSLDLPAPADLPVPADLPAPGHAFAPPVETAPSMPAHESFATPALDPHAVPMPGTAAPDPFAAPVAYEPAPTAHVAPIPFAHAAPEPEPDPAPYVAHDPYAPAETDPYQAYAAADPLAPAETDVPDWNGFSTPPSDPVPAMSAADPGPAPAEPRPAGVSIPPPGWTGAA